MENNPEAQERAPPDIIEPAGLSSEQKEAPKVKADPKLTFRKLDSEDVIRLRGVSLVSDGTKTVNGKIIPLFKTDVGGAQKAAVCLAVRSAPWFSDVIDERHGVTEEIFRRRMDTEFRKIPVDAMDDAYAGAKKFNEFAFEPEELQGK